MPTTLVTPPNSTGTSIDGNAPTTNQFRQLITVGDPSTGTAQQSVEALANNTYAGGAVIVSPTTWAVTSTPASATQATITKAAGGSGVQHVCQSITFSCAVDGTHAQTAIQVNLRDGGTGAGTILWSVTVLKAATEAITFFHANGLNIVAPTSNNPMTLEFSSAGVTGSVQSVSLTGYDIS